MKSLGIDIGKRKCFVCIMDEKGRVLDDTSYDNTSNDATEFAKLLIKKYKKVKAICESTGNMWIKTFDAFEKNNIPIKLSNPLKNKAIAGKCKD